MSQDPAPQLPDPNGPPLLSNDTANAVKFVASFGLKLFVGGAAATTFVLLATVSQPTIGAPRSQRLQWQEQKADRQNQIAEIQSQSESPESQSPSTPTEQPHD